VASVPKSERRARRHNPQPVGYIRRLVVEGPRTLIVSTCIRCGVKIVGSVSEGLPKLEADHLEHQHGIIIE
jgi:hypothetical protein